MRGYLLSLLLFCLDGHPVCSQVQATSLPMQCPAGSLLFPLGFSEPPVCPSQLSGEVSFPPSASRSHHIICWPPSAAFLSFDLLQCQLFIHLKFCTPQKVENSPFSLLVPESAWCCMHGPLYGHKTPPGHVCGTSRSGESTTEIVF